MQYAEGLVFQKLSKLKRSQKYMKTGQKLQRHRIYPTQPLAQILFFIHLPHRLQVSLPQTQARGAGTLDHPVHASTRQTRTQAPSVSWKQRLTAPPCHTERCRGFAAGSPEDETLPEIRDNRSDRSTYLSTWVPQTSSLTGSSETVIPSITKRPFSGSLFLFQSVAPKISTEILIATGTTHKLAQYSQQVSIGQLSNIL